MFGLLLERALSGAAQEKALREAFQAIREAYFLEYEDAEAMDGEFESSFRHIFDTLVRSGELEDGTEFDDLTTKPSGCR